MYLSLNLEQAKKLEGGLALSALVPAINEGLKNLRRYAYKGSLTTPPCYESVSWLIFKRPIGIPPNMVSIFYYKNLFDFVTYTEFTLRSSI